MVFGFTDLDLGMNQWASNGFKYPLIAKEMGIQGKVFVSFMIDKTGNVKEVKVLRGVDGHLDKEAVRLIKSLPKMQPAVQRGTPVSITYTIPIHFLLQYSICLHIVIKRFLNLIEIIL